MALQVSVVPLQWAAVQLWVSYADGLEQSLKVAHRPLDRAGSCRGLRQVYSASETQGKH